MDRGKIAGVLSAQHVVEFSPVSQWAVNLLPEPFISEIFNNSWPFITMKTHDRLQKEEPTTDRSSPLDLYPLLVLEAVLKILKEQRARLLANPAANGELAHTRTLMISSVTGPGIGSPCFSRLWR